MNIAMIGYGKMGHVITGLLKDKGHTVVTIDPMNQEADHQEISEASLKDADVCIDFTHPSCIMDNIKKVSGLGKNLVVGTTGWYEHEQEVKALIENSGTGFIWASNFSLGMNVMFAVNEYLAKLMNKFDDYDVAGVEYHHNQKADSPSGTAKSIAQGIEKNIDRKNKITYEMVNRKIEEDELHYASVRCGHIPGTHKVLYDSTADTIELSHTARSRQGFALGAVAAAEWLAGKKGFYDIQDMMKDIVGGN